jgi:class 3 adenylate cyclase
MGLINLAKTATDSPVQIRKLWRSGPEEKPPEWRPSGHQGADGQPCLDDPFSILSRAALEFGESFLALDIAETGIRALKSQKGAQQSVVLRSLSRLGHCKALALLRTGSTTAASQLLEELYQNDREDVEVAGALARTYKDFAFLEDNSAAKIANFERSHNLYYAAYNAAGDFFPGINAAATALWLGKRELAERLAHQIAAGCLTKLESRPSDFWLTVTLAESQLILRMTDEAADCYEQARCQIGASRKWANLGAARKQAQRICEHIGLDFSPYERIFRFPTTVVFSGHMFDGPDRTASRFPRGMEEAVRVELRKRLAQLNAGFGVSSASCGADFLFIEEMLGRGADAHVVLPWPKEDFIRSSVDILPDGRCAERFHQILGQVTSVLYLSQQTEPKETRWGYQYLNGCLSGLAVLRAKALNAELVPMAVWDLQKGDGPGGTSGFVSFWQEKGRKVQIIPLATNRIDPELNCNSSKGPEDESSVGQLTVARGQETIKTMLFADVLGYTDIPGKQTELFTTRFLAKISALIDRAAERPILTNTWGDAIYLVFDDVIAAGQFALMLRDLVQKTDWISEGISTHLSLRISLHTGPVLLCVDPIVRHMTITGAHVTHAARMEPKVTPGEIWASESFAAQTAIASLDRMPGFELDYLGQVELAKNYGLYGLFRLRAPAQPEKEKK